MEIRRSSKKQVSSQGPSLEQRLEAYPELKAKLEALLQVMENTAGDCEKADAAERRVIEELRQMGQQVLEGWAERQQEKQAEHTKQQTNRTCAGKKNSTGTRGWGRSKSRRPYFGKADGGLG